MNPNWSQLYPGFGAGGGVPFMSTNAAAAATSGAETSAFLGYTAPSVLPPAPPQDLASLHLPPAEALLAVGTPGRGLSLPSAVDILRSSQVRHPATSDFSFYDPFSAPARSEESARESELGSAYEAVAGLTRDYNLDRLAATSSTSAVSLAQIEHALQLSSQAAAQDQGDVARELSDYDIFRVPMKKNQSLMYDPISPGAAEDIASQTPRSTSNQLEVEPVHQQQYLPAHSSAPHTPAPHTPGTPAAHTPAPPTPAPHTPAPSTPAPHTPVAPAPSYPTSTSQHPPVEASSKKDKLSWLPLSSNVAETPFDPDAINQLQFEEKYRVQHHEKQQNPHQEVMKQFKVEPSVLEQRLQGSVMHDPKSFQSAGHPELSKHGVQRSEAPHSTHNSHAHQMPQQVPQSPYQVPHSPYQVPHSPYPREPGKVLTPPRAHQTHVHPVHPPSVQQPPVASTPQAEPVINESVQASPDSTTTAKGKKPRKSRKKPEQQSRNKKKQEDLVPVNLITNVSKEDGTLLDLLDDPSPVQTPYMQAPGMTYAQPTPTPTPVQQQLSQPVPQMPMQPVQHSSMPPQPVAVSDAQAMQVAPGLPQPLQHIPPQSPHILQQPGVPPQAQITTLEQAVNQALDPNGFVSHPAEAYGPYQAYDEAALLSPSEPMQEQMYMESENSYMQANQQQYEYDTQEPVVENSRVVTAVPDDEFAHLTPVDQISADVSQQPEVKLKVKNAFESSFLSFLQGEKTQTLSTITNSAIDKKPELPKYVPEPPRPRPPPPPKRLPRQLPPSHTVPSLHQSAPRPPRPPQAPANKALTNKAPTDKALTNKAPTDKAPLPINKRKASRIIEENDSDSEKEATEVTKVAKLSGGKTVSIKVLPPKPPMLKPPKKRVTDVRDVKEVKEKSERSELTTVPRQKLSRRAKDKQRRKPKNKDSDVDEISSGGGEEFDDTDSDPDWGVTKNDNLPFDQMEGDSDEEAPQKMQKRRASAGRGGTSRGRPVGGQRPVKPPVVNKPPAPAERPVSSDEEEAPHQFVKFEFVVNRSVMNGESEEFPIWRIESGSLLQRFSPQRQGAVILHRASSAYLTWSSSMEQTHVAVRATTIAGGRGTEVVRLERRFWPQHRLLKCEVSVTESDPWLQKLSNYLQVTCSQAIESGFLDIVQREPDGFHMTALREIESKLKEVGKSLQPHATPWCKDLLKCIMERPIMTIVYKKTPEGSCQACAGYGTARYVVNFSGLMYDYNTLKPDPTHQPAVPFRLSETGYWLCRCVHQIHHFRWRSTHLCNRQVQAVRKQLGADAMLPEVLEACLGNRDWINKMLRKTYALMERTRRLSQTVIGQPALT